MITLSSSNIFTLLSNGIFFTNMSCNFASNNHIVHLKNCKAFSDAALLNIDAVIDINKNIGDIEGMVIPTNILNLPLMLLQKLTGNKKSLLDGVEQRKNFSIHWQNDNKPVIITNPISFVLPSIFSILFSHKKTIINPLKNDLTNP